MWVSVRRLYIAAFFMWQADVQSASAAAGHSGNVTSNPQDQQPDRFHVEKKRRVDGRPSDLQFLT